VILSFWVRIGLNGPICPNKNIEILNTYEFYLFIYFSSFYSVCYGIYYPRSLRKFISKYSLEMYFVIASELIGLINFFLSWVNETWLIKKSTVLGYRKSLFKTRLQLLFKNSNNKNLIELFPGISLVPTLSLMIVISTDLLHAGIKSPEIFLCS